MSIDSHRRDIQRVHEEMARLQREKGRESEKMADLTRRINSASSSASRATNPSSLSSYLREIQRHQDEVARTQKKIADIEGKIAGEQGKLTDSQRRLAQEEQQELHRQHQQQEQNARQHEQRMRGITGKLAQHDVLHAHTLSAIEQLSQLPDKIVVLFLAANPLDQQQLRLDEEARAIAEMIRKSEHRDSVTLVSCWAVRPLDVLQAINEHKPRIVHFSGHGSNQGEIVFQDDAGQTKVVTKEAIVQTLAAASGEIQLVFFNTCYSRNQAEAVVQHVVAAIGMNTSIGDAAARVFSAQFYSAIGFGLSVKRAFEQAKAALMLEGITEHDTPELFIANGVDSEQLILVKPPGAG